MRAVPAHHYPTGRKQKGEPNSVPAFLKMLDPKLTKQFALAHQVRLGCMDISGTKLVTLQRHDTVAYGTMNHGSTASAPVGLGVSSGGARTTTYENPYFASSARVRAPCETLARNSELLCKLLPLLALQTCAGVD